MKIRVRAKAGGVLTVTDENGNAIEGLVEAEITGMVNEKPRVRLVIETLVAVDADAEVEKPAKKTKAPTTTDHHPV